MAFVFHLVLVRIQEQPRKDNARTKRDEAFDFHPVVSSNDLERTGSGTLGRFEGAAAACERGRGTG